MSSLREVAAEPANFESKDRDTEIHLKSQSERMPDSELGTEINSLSVQSNNDNEPSLLKSIPGLHQPAVESKRRKGEGWEIIPSFESPHTVQPQIQPTKLEGFLLKKIKQSRCFFKIWHKVLIDSVSVQVLFTNYIVFVFSRDTLY